PPGLILFPYTTLFRSGGDARDPGNLPQERRIDAGCHPRRLRPLRGNRLLFAKPGGGSRGAAEADLMVREAVWVPNDAVRLVRLRSEEHTSELQSRVDL